jgi:signal transduction histidine kinase
LADPARLQRVVRNLVDNALLYSPAGGRVEIESRQDDDFVHVSVSDDGPGVPAVERDRIFERFYRADRPRPDESVPERSTGAGLGLAIARGLVHAHGGQIWVESTPTGGADFHFTLPRAP